MLSYMLPVDEKPPPVPRTTTTTAKPHMQLQLTTTATNGQLTNGRNTSPISKETSVSSFISDGTTATATSSMTSTSDKSKPKLVINGGKHQTLKRVSFGSSKGSMVETLIFESPVQEEAEPSPIPENGNPFPVDHEQTEAEREKVRVTFFQQSKPQEVDLPDEPVVFTNNDFIMATSITMNDSNHIVYNRTESTESGWDNPFRPGGDLSREADEIVELIKGGKPITPTPGSQAPPLPSLDTTDDGMMMNNLSNNFINDSPKKITELNATKTTNNTTVTTTPPKSLNGNVKNDKSPTMQQQQQQSQPGSVDVKRGTIKPDGDASQIEHVTIKKKPKCKCCVIQ